MARAICALLAGLLVATPADYTSARRKVKLIEHDQVEPGSTISFSLAEANAYAREEVRNQVADGLRNTKVWFGDSVASGSATIDFVQVQTARGRPPGMLMRLMLSGEKDIQVTVRLASRPGEAKIDIEEVYINGFSVPQTMVDLLIEYYLTPRFPDAKIGQWFELRHNVDTIAVGPAALQLKFKP